MKKILLVTLVFALGGPAHAGTWFTQGETLNFQVQYGILKAGEAILTYTPDDEKEPYKIGALAKTTGMVKGLVEVRDEIKAQGQHGEEAYFLPKTFTLKLLENDYNTSKKVGFERTETATQAKYWNLKDGTPPKEATAGPGARDMLSALYNLRKVIDKPEVGQVYPQLVINLDDVYQLDLHIKNRQRMRTIFGKNTDVLIVKPVMTPLNNAEKPETDWEIWVTDDKHYIPIRIIVETRFGSFIATLKSGNMHRQIAESQEEKWKGWLD